MQLEGAAALTRGNWRAYDQFATMVPLRPRPRIGLLKTALGAVALLADRRPTALTAYALGQGEARRGMASDLAWHERLGSKTRAVRLMPDPEVRRVGIDRPTWRMVHHRAWFKYELRSGFALLVGKSETRHQRGDIQIAVRHR